MKSHSEMTRQELIDELGECYAELRESYGHIEMLERLLKEETAWEKHDSSAAEYYMRKETKNVDGINAKKKEGAKLLDDLIKKHVMPNINENDIRFSKSRAISNAMGKIKEESGLDYEHATVRKALNSLLRNK